MALRKLQRQLGAQRRGGKKLSPRATGSKKVESETSKAQKLRTLFNTSMIQAQPVLENIKQDPEWAQFKGLGEDNLTTAIKAANAALAAADFNRKNISDATGGLRKRVEPLAFEKACKAFVKDVQEPVGKLTQQTKTLVKQCEAGLAIDCE